MIVKPSIKLLVILIFCWVKLLSKGEVSKEDLVQMYMESNDLATDKVIYCGTTYQQGAHLYRWQV